MSWDTYIPNDRAYDYAPSFVITNGTIDYDLKANQSALWKNLRTAKGIVIKTDQTIGIKLNSTAMPKMTCTSAQAPFEFINKKLIDNAYITVPAGSDANIEVLLV